jgi:hypothetical protein
VTGRATSRRLQAKIGVLAGTTTEQGLRATLDAANVKADVVPAKTHDEGIKMLDAHGPISPTMRS